MQRATTRKDKGRHGETESDPPIFSPDSCLLACVRCSLGSQSRKYRRKTLLLELSTDFRKGRTPPLLLNSATISPSAAGYYTKRSWPISTPQS